MKQQTKQVSSDIKCTNFIRNKNTIIPNFNRRGAEDILLSNRTEISIYLIKSRRKKGRSKNEKRLSHDNPISIVNLKSNTMKNTMQI